MERTELNLKTGKIIQIQLTEAEVASAQERSVASKAIHSARTLQRLKNAAEEAEMRKMVDIEKGTSDAALAYQVELNK